MKFSENNLTLFISSTILTLCSTCCCCCTFLLGVLDRLSLPAPSSFPEINLPLLRVSNKLICSPHSPSSFEVPATRIPKWLYCPVLPTSCPAWVMVARPSVHPSVFFSIHCHDSTLLRYFFPVLLTGCSATEVAETAAGTVRTAEAAAAAALKRNKDQNLSSF